MSFLIFMFLTRECLGVSNLSALEGRIVKGYKVSINKYPHSVFLYFQKSTPRACGSSLISEQAVITAAHCLDEIKYHNGKITAYLGSTIPQYSNVKRNVILYAIHPQYNPEKGKYNLGLGFFNKPVSFNNELQKVPIIVKHPKVDEDVFTTGWGKQTIHKGTDYSDQRHLKVSKQRIMSEQDCSKTTGYKKTPAYWCTVSVNGFHYHGDTGNGLVNNKKFLIGVVSFMVNEMTVYSDVLREKLWIKHTLLELINKSCKKKKNHKKSHL